MHRLEEFDILRVAATFAVIAIHITAGYVLVTDFGFTANQVVRFAVPFFIIMSGFLLYHGSRGRHLPVAAFYRKRLDRILWPYLIWTIIYCTLNQLLAHDYNLIHLLMTSLKNLLLGSGYYHLYFLPVIFQLYLLYPLLEKWLDQSTVSLLAASLIITLTAQILLYLDMIHVLNLPDTYNLIYVRAFTGWLFYFVFGMFLARQKENLENALAGQVWVTGIIWLVSLMLLILDSKLTGTCATSLKPGVLVYTISSFIFFYCLAAKSRLRGQSAVAWISRQSFLIYLSHPFILTMMFLAASKLGHPGMWNGNTGLLTLYILTTAFTLLLTWLISLTPLASRLGGSHWDKGPVPLSQ